MTRETPALKSQIGTWRWEWRDRPSVKLEISLSADDWDDLRLLAAERCLTPQTLLKRLAKQHIEEWRRSQ